MVLYRRPAVGQRGLFFVMTEPNPKRARGAKGVAWGRSENIIRVCAAGLQSKFYMNYVCLPRAPSCGTSSPRVPRMHR